MLKEYTPIEDNLGGNTALDVVPLETPLAEPFIPFNRSYRTGRELKYVTEALANEGLAEAGPFTRRCQEWIEQRTGCGKALLTHSCTSALEMAALILDIQPGDEVIMPSFTHVSTANAFVLRGGVPVFLDIREDTLNLDERLIPAAITPLTRAIVPVHYAGVSCALDEITALAFHYDLALVEDAAHGFLSTYNQKALGSFGKLGATSFHETKNIACGTGGVLLVNDPGLEEKAETVRANGTDRSRFLTGAVPKYSWQCLGSSLVPGELMAAFLWAQLEEADRINQERMQAWQVYHERLEPYEKRGFLRRPGLPPQCLANGHIYYVVLAPHIDRDDLIAFFRKNKIELAFHFTPLHASPAGRRYGRCGSTLKVTDSVSERLARLPLWCGISLEQQAAVVDSLSAFLQF